MILFDYGSFRRNTNWTISKFCLRSEERLSFVKKTDQLIPTPEAELILVQQLFSGLTTPGFIDKPFHISVDLERSLTEQDLDGLIANADRLTYDHFFPIMRKFPLAFDDEDYKKPSNILHLLRSDLTLRGQLFHLSQKYYETNSYILSSFTEDEFGSFLRLYSNPITFRTRFGDEFKQLEASIFGMQSKVLDYLEKIKSEALIESEKIRFSNTDALISQPNTNYLV